MAAQAQFPARRTNIVRRSFFLALLALALGVLAPAANAQDAKRSDAQLARLDLTASPAVAVVRSPGQPQEVGVDVRGEAAKVTGIASAQTSGVPTATVLLVDTSEAAKPFFDTFKKAAATYVRGMKPGEELLVMGIGGAPLATGGFSSSPDQIVASLSALTPGGGTALWTGINAAAESLAQQRPNSIGNVVLIAGSRDTISKATPSQVANALGNAHAALQLVLYAPADYPADLLGQLATVAQTSGGATQRIDDVTKTEAAATSASTSARGLYSISFTSSRLDKAGNITFSVAGQQLTSGFIPGTLAAGRGLQPFPQSEGGFRFFQSDNGRLIGLALGALAFGLATFAVVSLFVREDNGLDSVLQPYSGELAADDEETGLAKSALFQRAVEVTSNFAERRGFLQVAEQMLEQASMPLRAAEALTFYAGIVLGSLVLSFVLTRSLLPALLLGAIAALLPPSFVNFKAGRRRKKFVSLLPDTLTLLAGTLKAGYSFMQGLEAVSHEVEEPMGSELRRVCTEAQLGRPVEEALEAAAARMQSDDFAWAVMAVRIQREVGGNLSELLLTVADTMTARERLRGEVKALTAEGRVSALVLGALPVLLGLAMYAINRSYTSLLFTETAGRIMLGTGIVAALIGFAWMKKIIDIKI